MKVVCSWCRREGKAELVGEKAPFDDARETHGICVAHRDVVHARWRASVDASFNSTMVSGLSSMLSQWTGLFNVTKRMRS